MLLFLCQQELTNQPTNQPTNPMKTNTKLDLLKIQVRSELADDCVGYADFLTEENFPDTGKTFSSNLLRLEEIRPGTLGEFAAAVMGF